MSGLQLIAFLAHLTPLTIPSPGVWLYLSPDVFLPFTSTLAALAGLLLIFWQRLVGALARLFSKRATTASKPGTPPLGEHR